MIYSGSPHPILAGSFALLVLAGCATQMQETEGPPAPTPPARVTFARTLDLESFQLRDREDLVGLVTMGLKLQRAHPTEARQYFLKVAERVPGTELAAASLAAAAMTAFGVGDREGFLALVPRLEAAVTQGGGLAPSPEVADLIALGRFMRRDSGFSGASPRLRRILEDVDGSR